MGEPICKATCAGGGYVFKCALTEGHTGNHIPGVPIPVFTVTPVTTGQQESS